jgi:AsmA-like C-terminal region
MFLKSARILVRTFYVLLILCATLLTLLILFLSQINLDDYRLSLEKQLSSALNQPVTIGHGSLTYSRGLALELVQLQIGNGSLPLATIPRLLATLKIVPLLDRKLILDQVRIDSPQINLTYPPPKGRPEKGSSHQLFNSLGISNLSANNAKVTIYQSHANTKIKRLEIDNLHAMLQGWQQNQSGHLVVSAKIPAQNAEILLETKLPASVDPQVWRREIHDLKLEVRRFSTDKLPKLGGQTYPEAVDLVIAVHGAPINGTKITTTLTDAKTDEKLFSVAGTWTSTEDQDALTELSGILLGIPLKGELYSLRQPDKNYLGGRFGAQDIQLSTQLLKKWRIPQAENLLQGNLDQLTIIAEKTWKAGTEFSGMPRIDTDITLTSLDWNIPELKQIQDLSVELSLINNNLSVKDGILVFGGEPIEFAGKISSLFMKPQISMNIQFTPQLDKIANSVNRLKTLGISGSSPGSLKLTGPLFSPHFKFNADLSPIKLSHRWLLQKKNNEAGSVAISGSLSHNRIDITQANLKLGKSTLSGAGYWDNNSPSPNYQISIDSIRLSSLTPYSPLLKHIQVKGAINLSLEQKNNISQGRMDLDNVGARMTSVIADLRKTTGTAQFDRHGLSFIGLKASLGESEFNINGHLSDWKSPILNLDIQADKVRAQDIIFPNRKRILTDVNGHLRIDGGGIYFAPVNVRLEDDTLARVSGSVTNFSDPLVDLNIKAETVDVLDVIDLFNGPRKSSANKKPFDLKPVMIKVSAKKGTLGGLHFKNASGLIKDHNNLFTLFPLRFENGDGWCQARVEFEHHDPSTPLRISGHVEGFDASVLHQDLFARPGLITGILNGDFYLEGNPHNNKFWNEAKGGIHVTISNGILRKFSGLAKVFSLLNVSQIFAGKLPDMDNEGMPFSLLEGNAEIGLGKITTKDLTITSEAMNLSMVGSQDVINDQIDFTLGVMPLRTVDKVITKIPIAGWILAGENKALITAYFKIEGPSEEPQVSVIPIDSVSKTVFGIFKRTLGLPGKLVKDVGSLFKQEPEKKTAP